MRDDNDPDREKPNPERALWAIVEPNRTRRVIMIDAERGAGKTSILLTLLDNWNRPVGERSDHKMPELFTKDDAPVRALPRLDFDPHPESIHAYAWLVLAFENVARFIDEKRGVVGSEDSLLETWGKLYKAALLGWSEKAIDAVIIDDVDAFVVDHCDGSRGWQKIERLWQDFIDKVVEELERLGRLPRTGLIVLPIDDLDLHPSMASQILLALRLLHHRRLVFLLCGDTGHLERILEIELFEKSTRRLALPENAPSEMFKEARALGRTLIDKVIPPGHRFNLKRLSLNDVATFTLGEDPVLDSSALVQWRQAGLWDLLNLETAKNAPADRNVRVEDSNRPWRLPSPAVLVFGGRRGPDLVPPGGIRGASLHLLFADESLGVGARYTRRDAANLRALFAQFRARPEAPRSLDRAIFAKELLARACDSAGERLFTNEGRSPNARSLLPMKLEMLRSNVEQRFIASKREDCSVEVFPALRLISSTRTKAASPTERAMETLLSIWSFAHGEIHPDVQLEDTPWSPLVVTRWRLEKFGLTEVFYWPGLTSFKNLCQMGPPLRQHPELAATWLSMNLPHVIFNDKLGACLQEGLKLVERARTHPGELEIFDDRFTNWFIQYFPVLAAPEFDLPEDQQQEILGFFLDNAQNLGVKVTDLRQWWQSARYASHLGAITARHDTTMGDPGNDLERSEVDALRQRISKALPNSLWEKLVEGPMKAKLAKKGART